MPSLAFAFGWRWLLLRQGVSRLRARPKGFAVALWNPSRRLLLTNWDSSIQRALRSPSGLLRASSNNRLRQVSKGTIRRVQPVGDPPSPLCGASVTRRSAQVGYQRKGSPEGSKTPLAGVQRAAPSGEVQGQRPWSPKAKWGQSRGGSAPSGGVQGQSPCSPKAKPRSLQR